MPTVRVDRAECKGYGNCVIAAGDVFDIDESGVVTVLRPVVAPEDLARIESAVRMCPVSALTIEADD